MRATETLIPTLREVPAEADTVSHQLLLRAGMLRRVAAGIYNILPLGHRVLSKIEEIVRQEMNRAGGIELLLPIVQPAELWQQTGRWDVYGPEMFRLRDRHGRDFCLGPTHEEVITDLVRQEVRSYRQLPLLLYQIQNKYRDERRPRFGLLRGREFIMKDLYSFDADEKGLEASYEKMYKAYSRIFSRCGLSFRVVEADPGAIGGSDTHEFMVMADTGEAEIVFCSSCDYAADTEKAPCPAPVRSAAAPGALERTLELVETPGMRTVDQVAAFLGISPSQVLKTMIYLADGQPVAVLLRGDRSVNEIKLKNFLQAMQLELASEEDACRLGIPTGYAGPVGLDGKAFRVLADYEVRELGNAVAGANERDRHYRNVNPGRDLQVDAYSDFRTAEEGDPCPRCGQPLLLKRGIEVGQIFKLGTKYSKALGATFLDERGREIPVVMGCYGLGVTRTMAAAVEQWYDDQGIIWPHPIAPYEVVLIPVNQRDPVQAGFAERLYRKLTAGGVDLIYDDRPERVGVKFKDADLIGYPVRLVVNERSAAEGTIEVRWRLNGALELLPEERIVTYLRERLTHEK
jgi:prolyl-tRNA synthetase